MRKKREKKNEKKMKYMTLENTNKTATVSSAFEVIITPFDTFTSMLCFGSWKIKLQNEQRRRRKEIGLNFRTH